MTVLTAAFALGGASLGNAASAQTGSAAPAELPAPAASAASAARPGAAAPGPRPRSLAETANRAAVPGDLRPERPVARQLSIPLGRTPPPPTPAESRAVRRGGAAATGGIDDAAARCESIEDSQARGTCRARAQREARARLPN